MRSKLQHDFDPLDLELIERAFESACVSVKSTHEPISELDTDEELEGNLRRELIEIALINGVSDPETLRDILLSTLSRT